MIPRRALFSTTITSKLQLPRTNFASSSTLRSIPIAASRASGTQTQRRTFASGKDATYSTMSKQDNSLFTRDNLFDLKGKVALVTG